MNIREALLEALPCLRFCQANQIDALLDSSKLVTVGPPDSAAPLVDLYRAEPPMVVCLEGLLVATQPTDRGAHNARFLVTPREFFMPSWSTAVASPVTISAMLPSKALCIEQVEILGLCAQKPEVALWLLETIHERHLAESRRWALQRSGGLELALCDFWWRVSRALPGGIRVFEGRLSQTAVAEFLGFSREEVSRKMKLLEQAGYLQRYPNKIVLNVESFAQMLDSSMLRLPPIGVDKLPTMLRGILQRSQAVQAFHDNTAAAHIEVSDSATVGRTAAIASPR